MTTATAIPAGTYTTDGVHGHAVGAVLREQLLGRGEDLVAVARGVRAQRRLVLEDRELFHGVQRNGHEGQYSRNRTTVRFLCYSGRRHENGPQSGPNRETSST